MNQITGYHFTGEKLRNGIEIPKTGEWLIHDGDIIPCRSGLHCSEHPFDALKFAPGSLFHKVILVGEIKSHGSPIDKHVGRKRKIIASIDAETLLWDFARWCALQVIHLWDAPDVVKEYLVTGNEGLRASARASAWASARASARASAWASASDSAWDSARASAWASAWDSARDSAWDSAWDSARDSAWDSAREKNRNQFLNMVKESFGAIL